MKFFRVRAIIMLLGLVGAIVILLSLSACTSPESKPRSETSAVLPGPGSDAAQNVLAPSYNLGDVDFSTVPSVRLSDRSKSGSIQYEEHKTLRGDVAVANATVLSPHPANLWIAATIESPLGYPSGDAVLVRMSVTVDTRKDPLETKTFVFSGKGLITHPERVELDLMKYLNPAPASVLVQSRIQIVWFPNTDPATINPDTVDVSKGQTLDKLSNPLRINFN
jgi:hypothetical protein